MCNAIFGKFVRETSLCVTDMFNFRKLIPKTKTYVSCSDRSVERVEVYYLLNVIQEDLRRQRMQCLNKATPPGEGK